MYKRFLSLSILAVGLCLFHSQSWSDEKEDVAGINKFFKELVTEVLKQVDPKAASISDFGIVYLADTTNAKPYISLQVKGDFKKSAWSAQPTKLSLSVKGHGHAHPKDDNLAALNLEGAFNIGTQTLNLFQYVAKNSLAKWCTEDALKALDQETLEQTKILCDSLGKLKDAAKLSDLKNALEKPLMILKKKLENSELAKDGGAKLIYDFQSVALDSATGLVLTSTLEFPEHKEGWKSIKCVVIATESYIHLKISASFVSHILVLDGAKKFVRDLTKEILESSQLAEEKAKLIKQFSQYLTILKTLIVDGKLTEEIDLILRTMIS